MVRRALCVRGASRRSDTSLDHVESGSSHPSSRSATDSPVESAMWLAEASEAAGSQAAEWSASVSQAALA